MTSDKFQIGLRLEPLYWVNLLLWWTLLSPSSFAQTSNFDTDEQAEWIKPLSEWLGSALLPLHYNLLAIHKWKWGMFDHHVCVCSCHFNLLNQLIYVKLCMSTMPFQHIPTPHVFRFLQSGIKTRQIYRLVKWEVGIMSYGWGKPNQGLLLTAYKQTWNRHLLSHVRKTWHWVWCLC
jgi:hypothetical protein